MPGKHNIRTIADRFPERTYAEGKAPRFIITIFDDIPPEDALKEFLLQEWPKSVCLGGCELSEELNIAVTKVGQDTFVYIKEEPE